MVIKPTGKQHIHSRYHRGKDTNMSGPFEDSPLVAAIRKLIDDPHWRPEPLRYVAEEFNGFQIQHLALLKRHAPINYYRNLRIGFGRSEKNPTFRYAWWRDDRGRVFKASLQEQLILLTPKQVQPTPVARRAVQPEERSINDFLRKVLRRSNQPEQGTKLVYEMKLTTFEQLPEGLSQDVTFVVREPLAYPLP